MAKKKVKKKVNQHAFDPTLPGYPSRKAFNKRIRRRAGSQIAPQLGDIRQRQNEATGAHKTRVGEINSFYGADTAARSQAQTRLQQGLTGLSTSLSDLTGDASAGLNAAFRQQADAASEAAHNIGGAAPTIDPQLAATMGAYGAGNRMGFAGEAAGLLGRGAADISMSGIEQRTAGTNEMNRNKSVQDALSKERSGVRATLPGIIEQMRASAIQEQLAMKQNQLAESQFGETKRSNRAQEGLSQQQIDEAKRQGSSDRKIARRNAKLNENQLALARDELAQNGAQAVGEAGQKQAEAQSKRFENAVEWFQGYLKPNDQDKVDDENGKSKFNNGLWRKNRNFAQAAGQISAMFPGMSEGEIMRVLATAPFHTWRARAQRRLFVMGLRQRPRVNPTGGNAPGIGHQGPRPT